LLQTRADHAARRRVPPHQGAYRRIFACSSAWQQ